jgi:cold shock CspA family protein
MLALGIKSLSTARVSAMRALNLHTSLASRYFSSETGSVKFYIRRKAFGFITRDSTGDDIFVHRTEISGATSDDPFNPELRTGERVKFEVKEMNGKTFATQVTMEDGSMVPKMRDDVSYIHFYSSLLSLQGSYDRNFCCNCSFLPKEFDP